MPSEADENGAEELTDENFNDFLYAAARLIRAAFLFDGILVVGIYEDDDGTATYAWVGEAMKDRPAAARAISQLYLILESAQEE
jgi:hypothetical protein